MPRWISASALAGALALHALPLAALLTMGTPQSAALEEAAITVFADPGGAPVATASEVAGSTRPAAAETATTREVPAEPQLDDALPPPEPMDAQAVPDFRPPVPPPPELRDAVPLPEVREAEAPDYKKQMPELRDAVPPPEPREAAVPDFRPPPAPPKQEPRKPAPPSQQQKAEPKPAPPPRTAAPAPAPSPAPSTTQSPHSGFAGAAPPAASAQPGGAPVVAPGWNALLAAWLAANRRYPEEARRRSIEGEVTVRFSVAADGRVTDVAITAGSGSSALDGAAVAMLRGARLPPPGTDVTRTVRIRYRLAD